MSELVPIYSNVNEEGEVYGQYITLEPALTLLREFPNDHIRINLIPKERT